MRKHEVKKIQLGCGGNFLTGWLNSDFLSDKNKISIDIRKKLPFESNSVDYVFMEHCIEHIKEEEGILLLREIYRILKKDGRMRLSTPSLDSFYKKNAKLKEYSERVINNFKESYPSNLCPKAYAINLIFYGHGHKVIYDFDSLKKILALLGYERIKKALPGKSNDKNLRGIERHGEVIGEKSNRIESLCVEAFKK